ncbi:MAG: PAS domain S-box protein [Dehalococcoidia bacterium]
MDSGDATSDKSSLDAVTGENERYRALFERAPDAIVVLDPTTGRFVDANTSATALFGYTRDEFLQLGPAAISPELQPDGRTSEAAAREAIQRALSGDEQIFEWTHQDRPGNRMPCEVRLSRIPAQPSALIHGRITDIRARKAEEAALAARERTFRTLAENSPDWIIRFDTSLRRLYVNPAVLAVSGRKPEELLGLTPTESYPDSEEMEVFETALRRCLETRSPQVVERETTVAGDTRVLQSSIVCEFDEQGEVESLLAVTRDITPSRKAADAEARLASIVDSAGEAIMSATLDGTVTSWNAGAERLFGHRAEDVVGKTVDFLFGASTPEDRDQLRDRVFAGETIEGLVARWPTADGGSVTAATTLFPLRNSTGEIIGTASIARDLTAEQRAQSELSLSQQRLRLALAASRMGTWTYDSRTGVLEFSEEAAVIYERPRDQMPTTMHDALALFHPEDLPDTLDRLRSGIPAGSMPREYRIRLPDGSYRWIAGIGDLTSSDGVVTGIVMDVDERNRAEQTLKESEERFRAVVNATSVGIVIFDGESVLQANPAAGRIFGVPAESLTTPGGTSRFIDSETARVVRERALARARGEAVPSDFEVLAHKDNGEPLYLLTSANPIDLGGRRVSLVTIIDVTERRLAEQNLRESEAKFRSLVDNSPDYITRFGRDLRIEFANRMAETQAGSEGTHLLGQHITELKFPPAVESRWNSLLTAVIETGQPVEFEYILGEDGPKREYRMTRLIPEVDETGFVRHVLAVVTDMTAARSAEEERRRLDLQMQHTQKLESLGVLAGGIAHDFNNLLVAILGNAGLALIELPPESPARQTVQAIETAAQRAAELTRQMLAYSGKGQFVVEPLNLSKVVEEMAHLLEVSVVKGATLKYRFGPNLPAIEGDATQIRQVIMNLIINASDAIGDRSGVISISTGMLFADRAYLEGTFMDGDLPEGDYVFLEVADTGVGMDAETQQRIFDPFFTTKFTGRGLGLAAVLGIIRGHRGAVKLYSEPGRGTTFKILFPAGSAAAEREPADTDTPGAGIAGRTILVVDDDETVRSVTRRIIELAGANVLTAEDGLAGLEVYQANPGIDLVLVDMTMPRMDGEETFRELRRIDPDVRVVLMSGYSEQDATERFAGKSLAGFIQKPYRPADLVAQIQKSLDNS